VTHWTSKIVVNSPRSPQDTVHRQPNVSCTEGGGPKLTNVDETNSHDMTKHNSTPVHEDISHNIDVPTIDDPIFEAPWPWLVRFGVLVFRSWHPSCSFWVATCTFLPLAISCSPRNRKVWVDLKANKAGNRIRRFFGLPEIWNDEIEGGLARN
jgi:hypothetical protein